MAAQQVYSPADVTLGQVVKLSWIPGSAFPGDGGTVPPGHTLEITSITLAYFPTGDSSLGRADIAGRDGPNVGTGTSIWRLQAVYVEPKKTLHLTFPKALMLKAGGHVELNFLDEGPGTIHVDVNGVLVGG